MWRAWLCDTMTGLVDVPLDLPSFRWSVSVSDCSMSTTRDSNCGVGMVNRASRMWWE